MDRLCICVRCHDYVEFVVDTLDSIKHYVTTDPYIMVAIDSNDENGMADVIRHAYPDIGIYISPVKCGWGKGLYRLLANGLKWAKQHYEFDHYCVVDYDTLFIREGADAMLLSQVNGRVGLIGAMQHPHNTWIRVINKYMAKIVKHVKLPVGYEKGRSILGAMMVLTQRGITAFRRHNYFEEPYLSVLGIPMPDDLWISMLTYSVGLEVKNVGSYTPDDTKHETWKRVAITWSKPTPPQIAFNGGAYVYHPAKGQSGGKLMSREERQMEREFREMFSRRRK